MNAKEAAERWPGGGLQTEQWRRPLTPLAKWAPIDFLLAWIDVESNGKLSTLTSLGERGLFQEHPDEKGFLGLTDEAFLRLSTDPTHSLRVGVNHAIKFAIYAKRFLAEVGQDWHGRDFWALTKLLHGGFAIPPTLLRAFKRTYGRGPASWQELTTFAQHAIDTDLELVPGDPKTSAKIRRLLPSTIANAETTVTRSRLPQINPVDMTNIGDLLRRYDLML